MIRYTIAGCPHCGYSNWKLLKTCGLYWVSAGGFSICSHEASWRCSTNNSRSTADEAVALWNVFVADSLNQKCRTDDISISDADRLRIAALVSHLAKTSSWRFRKNVAAAIEHLDWAVVPSKDYLEQRDWLPAADNLLCAYDYAKEFIAVMESGFPQIKEKIKQVAE